MFGLVALADRTLIDFGNPEGGLETQKESFNDD